MFTVVLYSSALLLLIFSFFRNREKTKSALKKAWRSFENILPSMLSILLMIGLILSVLNEKTISRLIGTQSGALGMIIAAVIGCITLLPGYVAIPLAASLVQAQIAIFISTLMMVGVATFPLEVNYFGRKIALKRNALSLTVAIISACLIGVVMG